MNWIGYLMLGLALVGANLTPAAAQECRGTWSEVVAQTEKDPLFTRRMLDPSEHKRVQDEYNAQEPKTDTVFTAIYLVKHAGEFTFAIIFLQDDCVVSMAILPPAVIDYLLGQRT